ncbi:helix-turn-helix domain-containing protein [Amycolatopsis panacis]|uniref:helix-turn-helix domain-containing protein n=1 Tax=Amycolatopsis panacis TaxID=2340917 RepID=UPI001F446A35|nr:helix-turn-helix transcriptional regulator [Amycolatopsis panacis]
MAGDDVRFGIELRRWRTRAGISLADFAAAVHYSKGHLSKIENGLKHAQPEFARRCDAELDAGGRLAALAGATEARPRPVEVADDGEAWMMNLTGDGAGWFRPMGRREALALGAAAGFSMGVPARVRSVEGTAAVAFRRQFDQIRKLGQTASPGVVLPTLVAQTHTVRALTGQAGADESGQLFRLASRFAEFAGWMTQEAGDERGALWWTDRAVEMAASGGDRHFASYALTRRALISLYRDDAAEAIGLAQQAQRGAVPARILGFAAQHEAQGHALAGDYDTCMRALDRARPLLIAPAEEGEWSSPVLGTTNLDDPAAMAVGWCLLDLGRPREAAVVLDRQLESVPGDALRTRARYGARRALAYAQLNEIEQACALVSELLGPAEIVGSATVAQDLLRLKRIFSRHLRTRAVQEVYPQLTLQLSTTN